MRFILPLVVLAVFLAFVSLAWQFQRGEDLLQRWAAREGLTILSAQYCWLWRGPFWWRSGNSNSVYRVLVRDRDGRERSGYVRCGSLWAGMLSTDVTVVWDG